MIDPRSVAGKTPAVLRHVPVVVVGAGPAGVAAATAAARAGAPVLLVDEHPLDIELMAMDVPLYFGQRMSPAVRDRRAMLERVVQANPGLEAATEAGVDVQLGTSVWGAFRPGPTVHGLGGSVLGLADTERSWLVGYDRLVVAAGARDLGVAFRGWQRAGTMGALGALTLMARYRAFAARRLVVLGSGPLGLHTAAAALDRGVDVAAVVEVGPEVRGQAALRQTLERRGVRFYTSHAVQEAGGVRDEVETLVLVALDADLRPVAGRSTEIPCDTVCLAVGRVPSVELLEILGCRLAFRSERGGFVPETGAGQRTSVPEVYAAGDCAGLADDGIADSGPAIAQGRRAGLAAAASLGATASRDARGLSGATSGDGAASGGDATASDGGAASAGSHGPRGGSSAPVHDYWRAWVQALGRAGGEDTIVCQCEEVTRRELNGVQPPRYLAWRSDPMSARSLGTLAQDGPVHPDQVKRLTRAGMGPCQGRRCREQVALLLGEAAGVPVEAIPLASYRAPIRPLPLAVLWPHDEPADVREQWVSWFGIPTQFAPHWAGDPVVESDPAAGARPVLDE